MLDMFIFRNTFIALPSENRETWAHSKQRTNDKFICFSFSVYFSVCFFSAELFLLLIILLNLKWVIDENGGQLSTCSNNIQLKLPKVISWLWINLSTSTEFNWVLKLSTFLSIHRHICRFIFVSQNRSSIWTQLLPLRKCVSCAR